MRNNSRCFIFFALFLSFGIFSVPNRVKAQSPFTVSDSSSLGSIHYGMVYKEAKGLLINPNDTLNYLSFLPIYYPPLPYKNQITGFQASLENSFILGYFIPQTHKRFRWGDSFLGQLSFGEEFSNIEGNKSSIWGAYRFEIGMVGEYIGNSHFKIFLHWKPLVYEKDVITPFISGSSLGLDVLASRLSFGASLLARDARIIGFIQALSQPSANPHDFEFNLGYHFTKKSEIQFKSRWYNPSTYTTVNNYPQQNLQQNLSIQIMYGRLF